MRRLNSSQGKKVSSWTRRENPKSEKIKKKTNQWRIENTWFQWEKLLKLWDKKMVRRKKINEISIISEYPAKANARYGWTPGMPEAAQRESG